MKRAIWSFIIGIGLCTCTAKGSLSDPTTTAVSGAAPQNPNIGPSQTYEVVETLAFSNQGDGKPEKFNAWVALIRTIAPYQEILAMD